MGCLDEDVRSTAVGRLGTHGVQVCHNEWSAPSSSSSSSSGLVDSISSNHNIAMTRDTTDEQQSQYG